MTTKMKDTTAQWKVWAYDERKMHYIVGTVRAENHGQAEEVAQATLLDKARATVREQSCGEEIMTHISVATYPETD